MIGELGAVADKSHSESLVSQETQTIQPNSAALEPLGGDNCNNNNNMMYGYLQTEASIVPLEHYSVIDSFSPAEQVTNLVQSSCPVFLQTAIHDFSLPVQELQEDYLGPE